MSPPNLNEKEFVVDPMCRECVPVIGEGGLQETLLSETVPMYNVALGLLGA
jgi:hypothetical protein